MPNQDIFHRRRENLNTIMNQLMNQHGFKTGVELCHHYQLSAVHISQLINSHRHIGAKTARQIETKLGIALQSLDQALDLSPIEEQIVQALHKDVSVYEMQSLQEQAFHLNNAVKRKLSVNFHGRLSDQHYLIQVVGQAYFPTLASGWYVLCDEYMEVVEGDYVHLHLVNQVHLLLVLIAKQQKNYQFQSLDGTRSIALHQDDILKIHAILALYPPHHIFMKS